MNHIEALTTLREIAGSLERCDPLDAPHEVLHGWHSRNIGRARVSQLLTRSEAALKAQAQAIRIAAQALERERERPLTWWQQMRLRVMGGQSV